jgi:fructoselysine 6-kinase
MTDPLRIAAIGDNCVDYYSNLERYYVTGNAVDTAVNVAQQGMPCAIITSVATDAYGDEMYAEFVRQNLDITRVKRVPGKTAITYMELHGNERVHGEYEEGVMADIVFDDEDIQFAASHTLVHSAYWGMAEEALKRIKAANPAVLISYDFADRLDHERLDQLKGVVDIGFFSYDQRDEWIEKFLTERVAEGMKIAVATLGENGSVAYDGKEFYSYGIFEAQVENTIGAGDSFIAGFIAEYLRSKDITASLANGAQIAAKVIEVFGPWL